jgi:putative endonuclease
MGTQPAPRDRLHLDAHPVKLVFVETCERIVDAIEWEQQTKKWLRRKKEALIAYDYEALPALAGRPKRVRQQKPQ